MLEFIARDCKVPCHDRVSCLVALKLAFVHLVSQQIKFSQMQDKVCYCSVVHYFRLCADDIVVHAFL